MIKKIERSSAGVEFKDIEEQEIPDICRACPFGSFCYKYVNPDICIALKEDMDKEETRSYHSSPPSEEVAYYKILSYWNCETREKLYRYYRVKSIVDCNGYRVLSVRKSTAKQYVAYQRKRLRQKLLRPQTKLPASIPNPWM